MQFNLIFYSGTQTKTISKQITVARAHTLQAHLCRRLLPRRPPSRQTEVDIWTILLGWSIWLHSAFNPHTHSYNSGVYNSSWVVGLHVVIALLGISETCQLQQMLFCCSLLLTVWKQETKTSQGAKKKERQTIKQMGEKLAVDLTEITDGQRRSSRQKSLEKCFHIVFINTELQKCLHQMLEIFVETQC